MDAVNETTIERLLGADLVIRQALSWTKRDPADRRVRLRVPVANRLGEPVWLHMHVPLRMPWQYSLVLVWRKHPIRRLDVRGSHVNQSDGSDERWQNETHKHKWRDGLRDSWAFSPTDIPATGGAAVGPGEHRRVFEAFCAECQVRLESQWVGPDLDGPHQDTMGGA